MKKIILFSILLILAAALSACAGANTDSNNGSNSEELSLSTKLLIGTLKLEGTPQAVDAKEAANLLPLWNLLKSLTSSDTSAQQEIDSIVGQIQAAMTPEQLQAIDAMKLTRQDTFRVMQDLGLVTQDNSSGTPEAHAQGQGGDFGGPPAGGEGGDGGGHAGGGEGGGSGFSGGQNLDPQQIATAQARRSQEGRLNRIPQVLLDALIKLLETRSQS